MSILKLLSILFVITSCVSLSQAQVNNKKPDFSGVWKFDHSKSTASEIGKRDAPIKIVYNDPEFRITRTIERNGQSVERDFVYYTDGRGETNVATMLMTSEPGRVKPEDIDKEIVKSKTMWQHGKVVTRSTTRDLTGAWILEYDIIDEWKISSDGKTLTQTSRIVFQADPTGRSVVVPANRPDDKRVFSLMTK